LKNQVYDWEEIVLEGRAKIIIPRMNSYLREDRVYEPAWSPVFYNPLMRISRDLTSLLMHSLFGEKSYYFIDALSGSGVRGVRLVLESNGYGLLNDVDPVAYLYIVRNIRLNEVGDKARASHCEANTLLNNYTFSGIPVDYIDIDPYGSPIPYIDSAVKPLAKNAYLGVTATDSGPLTCSHWLKALRRYNIVCIDTDFDKELGLRILIYNIVYRGSSQDVALKPILSYSHRYYYRVFFKTVRSGGEAYKLLDNCRGYLWYCKNTLERGFVKNPLDNPGCSDGSKPLVTGPLWICSLGEEEVVEQLYQHSLKIDYVDKETVKLLGLLRNEISVNEPYVRVDKLFSILGLNMPPLRELIALLNTHGFKAYRSHFDPRAVKTNACVKDIAEIFRRFSQPFL